MKFVKIKTLTLIDDLNLKLSSSTKINLGNGKQFKGLYEKLIAEASKVKGVIIAKSLTGQEPSVTANIKTKDGHTFQLPEPNPVHLYFQNSCNHLLRSQQLLKELKNIDPLLHDDQYNKFLEYFNEVTIGITFLVTTVEAFVNQHIPENYVCEFEGKELNKESIEWKDLKTKLKHIIPRIHGKHFLKTSEKEYCYILEIQDLRDDLIHLKTEHKDNRTYYENVFVRLLNFESDKYVSAVFLYLNSLKEDYIEETI